MKVIYRILFQVLFWTIVWIILGLNRDDFSRFLGETWIVLLFQITLILCLVYWLAPKLLFKKKYVLFIILSIAILVCCSFISSEVLRILKPPRVEPPKGHKPTAFFIHFLLMSLAYILATVVETFLFAQKKEEALLLSKTETLATELKLLKAQINPHFLFNSLNNIYALSAIDSVKTQQSISYLSDMLRYVIYECEKPWVALKKEIKYIEDYIKLFILKSSKEYPINLNLFIEDPNLSVAPMLLIPFVENAFKHSNIEKVAESFINITITSKDTLIIFKIENSFSEKPQQKDRIGGIGIKNVQRRLSIVYPENHTLIITDSSNVFMVELKLEKNV